MRAIAFLVLSLPLVAQTKIDLAKQATNADFSGYPATKPTKVGTTLPATCSTGELFFKSDATAGQNLYGCISNAWFNMGGIGSLNGLVDSTQSFAKVDDANVTLSIGSATATHTFTLGWSGTLAVGRGGTGLSGGTSGGIPYFSGASAMASSGELASGAVVVGGGAGVSPSTSTLTAGVVKATSGVLSAASASDIPDLSATYQVISQRNAASGYAGLDGGARIAKAQAPSSTVYTDAANTYSAGAQDFGSASSLKVPTSAGASPALAGLFAYDSSSNTYKGNNGSAAKTFAFADANLSGFTDDITSVPTSASSVVRRDGNGYIYGGYINTTNGDEAFLPDSFFVAIAGDGYHRRVNTPTAYQALVASQPHQINFVYGGSASTAIDATTVNNVWRAHAYNATITEVACWTDAGTVTLAVQDSAGNMVTNATLSCSSAGVFTTSMNAAYSAITIGEGLGFTTSSVSSVKNLSVSIKYTRSY